MRHIQLKERSGDLVFLLLRALLVPMATSQLDSQRAGVSMRWKHLEVDLSFLQRSDVAYYWRTAVTEGKIVTKPIRWGILGTGGIARNFAKDLTRIEEGFVQAVGSRSLQSANEFADLLSIESRYGSYEELVVDPNVDAIYVATPHPFHLENSKLALSAGKAVLCEKPLTMSGEQSRELVNFARSNQTFLMEAMWSRFLPHMFKLRELLRAGVLGEIVLLTADHGQWFKKNPEHRLFSPELGGGAILDLGVYPISFASMVLGKPSVIVGHASKAFTGVDGNASIIFGYENGAHALLNTTSLAVTQTAATINGTEARIEIDRGFFVPTKMRLISRKGEIEEFSFDTQGGGLQYQAIEVARCIESGALESSIMPLDESIAIADYMDTALSFLQ